MQKKQLDKVELDSGTRTSVLYPELSCETSNNPLINDVYDTPQYLSTRYDLVWCNYQIFIIHHFGAINTQQ